MEVVHRCGSIPLAGEDWTRLIGLLSACERELRKSLTAETTKFGLSDSSFLLLLNCRQAGAEGIAQFALAEKIGASPSNASGLIEQLRQRGLIAVERPASDRRRQIVRLTHAGSQTVDEIMVGLAEWTARLHERISRDEIRRGTELLSRVSKVAKETPVLGSQEPLIGGVPPFVGVVGSNPEVPT